MISRFPWSAPRRGGRLRGRVEDACRVGARPPEVARPPSRSLPDRWSRWRSRVRPRRAVSFSICSHRRTPALRSYPLRLRWPANASFWHPGVPQQWIRPRPLLLLSRERGTQSRRMAPPPWPSRVRIRRTTHKDRHLRLPRSTQRPSRRRGRSPSCEQRVRTRTSRTSWSWQAPRPLAPVDWGDMVQRQAVDLGVTTVSIPEGSH